MTQITVKENTLQTRDIFTSLLYEHDIKAGEEVLQFNLFGIFVKVFFGQCVGPVLKSLPYYW